MLLFAFEIGDAAVSANGNQMAWSADLKGMTVVVVVVMMGMGRNSGYCMRATGMRGGGQG